MSSVSTEREFGSFLVLDNIPQVKRGEMLSENSLNHETLSHLLKLLCNSMQCTLQIQTVIARTPGIPHS